LLPWLDDPFYILKRELMWIPLFGQYVSKMKMIPVNRGARGKVMAEVLERTKEEIRNGRQLIIYPEGTRRPAGAPPDYKYGIARLYRDLDVPVVPVVMHPGLFWPRRKFLRYPGHFKVQILQADPARHGSRCIHAKADRGHGDRERRAAGRNRSGQSAGSSACGCATQAQGARSPASDPRLQ
jgi:1-acyl-sn-glycerol-3-phosphate acyltransferase